MHEASKMTGYHQDYLGQVARSGKLKARKLGRNWFTSKLAVDMFLGRVTAEPERKPVTAVVEETIAPVIETVVTPIIKVAEAEAAPVAVKAVAEVKPEVKVTTAPAVADVAPEEVKVPRINIIRQQPAVEPVVAAAQELETEIEPQEELSTVGWRINVNVLSVSPDAGPNLQEAIAVPMPERMQLAPSVDMESRNTFHRLNKLVESRKGERPRKERAPGNFFPDAVRVRGFSIPALAGFAVVLIAAAVGSAYYFSGSVANNIEPPNQEVAGASTSVVGRGQVLAGQSQVVVNNDSIDAASVILVSFRSDQPGRHWVTGQSDGRFTLMLNEPAPQDLHFDYWVAAEVPDGGDPGGGDRP